MIENYGTIQQRHDLKRPVGLLLSGAVLFPSVLTHCAAMCIAYIWILSLVLLINYTPFQLLPRFITLRNASHIRVLRVTISCLLSATLAFLTIVVFQTTIVYGILLYSGEGYLKTIAIEFNLRYTAGYVHCLETAFSAKWTTLT